MQCLIITQKEDPVKKQRDIKMKEKNNLIGAHVSIVGGFDQAIVRGEKINANCIQIFTKSNRQWRAKKITEIEAKKFAQAQKNSKIQIVVAHASYLINVGSSSLATQKKSIAALTEEIQRCAMLKIPYLVLHPGTFDKKNNLPENIKITATNIDKAITQAKTKNITILLETMAGQGSTAGSTFEELAELLKKIKHKKQIGICVDTCHIFAAGYNFSTKKKYHELWKQFDKIIGIKKIKVIHVNDSKKECGSKVDRHEHIGKGKIGEKSFKFFMQDSHFKNIPKIIETPKDDNEFENDAINIKKLKKLAE